MGDFVLFKGPSGSGKSTFARCLAGLIPHLYNGSMDGEVLLAGHNTKSHPLWLLAEYGGMVFQNPSTQMLGATVEEEIIFGLENLGLPKEEITQRVNETISQFSLESHRQQPPQTLSGGEQQKLALASIMARRPAVLILDEPFSMLDLTAATDLIANLQQLNRQGITIIVFEHREEYFQEIERLKKITINGTHSKTSIPKPVLKAKAKPSLGMEDFYLSIRDISVQLGNKRVLENLDMQVNGGEVTAIVGRNGTGKTTLLRAIAGVQPYQGQVDINGARPDLGLVYQNADLQLFNATVRDEIIFQVSDPDPDYLDLIMHVLGLLPYKNTPPLLLSEGEKKRVALASVLMRKPKHGILLDEPSLGQDPAHKDMLIRLAKMLTQSGQIILMTTHDLSLAVQSDKIFLLGDGEIIAHGLTNMIIQDDFVWKKAGLFIPNWVKDKVRVSYV
jgi:energy-coupling factor transport system ATP-binding protein